MVNGATIFTMEGLGGTQIARDQVVGEMFDVIDFYVKFVVETRLNVGFVLVEFLF